MYNIFVDQAGYLPRMAKTAAINKQADRFDVENSAGEVCYSAAPQYIGYDSKAGEEVWLADFTSLEREGRYCIVLSSGERSCSFEISEGAYRGCFDAAAKAFYFLRCGCGLDERHAGEYKHPPCHTGNALVWDDRSVSLDVRGGWHDAGDYGRYSTAGACALAHLLYAYQLYPAAFKGQSLNIPESGGSEPDILVECRVELDWLMKMQRGDGAVYHKLTTKGHAPFIMPEEDTEQLYLLPPSSMAAADTAAVLALASGVYREYDAAYADRLLERALLSYSWLKSNPDFLFDERRECTTGSYGERDDRDNRAWAAAELFALTGEQKYSDYMLSMLGESNNSVAFGYGDMSGLAKLAYLLSGRGGEGLTEKYTADFVAAAERISAEAESGGYRCSLSEREFGWGSNMGVLTNAMRLLIADRLTGGDKYEQCAAEQLHYLLGKNPLGYSYVSGIGEHCINYPHLRPAHADGIEKCIPGMVSGGANRYLSDPFAKRLIPEGTAPMKCFADDFASYSLNEITIYWNSPAVFVLAHFNS